MIGGYMNTQIASLDGELSAYKDTMFTSTSEIKTDVASVKTDVSWLKSYFEDAQTIINEY